MKNKIPTYLLISDEQTFTCHKKANLSFIDTTLLHSAKAIKTMYLQAENADKKSIIHKIHSHIKLISLIFLVVVVSVLHTVTAQLWIFAFIFFVYVLSKLNLFQVYRKIFLLAFFFGFFVSFPAALNIFTPGDIIINLFSFDAPSKFWIYSIPANIGFTKNGFEVVSILFLRVLNSVSFSLLIVYTTSFPAFIKSFKLIGIPDTFLMIISLAYKFIFILTRTIDEVYFALKSRLSVNLKNDNIRELVSGRVFYIFKRSAGIYENTYNAMVSRGYHGRIFLHSQNKIGYTDFIAVFIVLTFGIILILV